MTIWSRRRPGTSRTWPPSRSSTTTSPPRMRRCVPFSISTSPTFASTRANVDALSVEAARVADRLAEAGRAIDRHARRLTETADSSGISRDGSPADTGEDLPVTAKARAAARRDDIREVRDHLALVRDAERDRQSAETSLGTARQSMEAWETSCREAGERLAAARADLSLKLEAWAGRGV